MAFIETDEYERTAGTAEGHKNASTRNHHFTSLSVCPVSQGSLQPLLSFTIPITERCRTYGRPREIGRKREERRTPACCNVKGVPGGDRGLPSSAGVTLLANSRQSPPLKKTSDGSVIRRGASPLVPSTNRNVIASTDDLTLVALLGTVRIADP